MPQAQDKPLGSVEILCRHLVRTVSNDNFNLKDYHASRDTAREIDDYIEKLKKDKKDLVGVIKKAYIRLLMAPMDSLRISAEGQAMLVHLLVNISTAEERDMQEVQDECEAIARQQLSQMG